MSDPAISEHSISLGNFFIAALSVLGGWVVAAFHGTKSRQADVIRLQAKDEMIEKDIQYLHDQNRDKEERLRDLEEGCSRPRR